MKMILRQCFVCRKRDSVDNLIRLVVEDGKVVRAKRRMGGRGANIHKECMSQLVSPKVRSRAFKGVDWGLVE
mgnify:CR=1 FL=1